MQQQGEGGLQNKGERDSEFEACWYCYFKGIVGVI